MTAQSAHPISALMFVTLGIVIVLVAGVLIWHLRKPGNRKPMAGERERNIGEIHDEGGERPGPGTGR